MNKKILSALLTGAFFLASTSVFVSCKDYDDDIKNLQEQINANAKTIEQINTLVTNGAVIKSVTKTTDGTGGIIIAMENGDTYTITNGAAGAAGKDADVWTIGSDGYWYKNGEKSDYKAKGEDGTPGTPGTPGDPGTPGTPGKDGKYYVPGEDGFWYVVENGVSTKTDQKWATATTGAISVAYDEETGEVKIQGVEGFEDGIVLAVNNTLRGLVFVGDVADTNGKVNRRYVGAVPAIIIESYKYNVMNLSGKNSSAEKTAASGRAQVINPETYAYYHVNPSTANVEDLKTLAYNVIANGDYMTRATASADFDVTPEFVEFKDGILKVKVAVKGEPATAEKISTVALQVTKDDEGTVTSDYATIFKQDLNQLRIAKNVRDAQKRLTAAYDYDYRRAIVGISNGDQDAAKGASIWNRAEINNKPVWDLSGNVNTNQAKDIDLYLKYNEEFDLNDSVEIHNVVDPHTAATLADIEAKFGLKVKYEVVENYKIGSNQTDQKDFITLTGSVVKAKVFNDTQSADPLVAAIDRTPIIRATLYDPNHNDQIVEVAYMKIKWVKEASLPIPDEEKTIPITHEDLDWSCSGDRVQTTVEQINVYLYNQFGYDSRTFHDVYPSANIQYHNTTISGTGETATIIKDTEYPENVGTVQQVEQLGANGETTYILQWTVSAEEMWQVGDKNPVKHTIVFVSNSGAKLAVTLTAKLTGVDKVKTYTVPNTDKVPIAWRNNYAYTEFNSTQPETPTDINSGNFYFKNDLNNPFEVDNQGILRITNATLSTIEYKFDTHSGHGMQTINKMAGHDVVFTVTNNGLDLNANVKRANGTWTGSLLVARITNDPASAAVPQNRVELANTEADQLLLNDQTEANPFYALYVVSGKICSDQYTVNIKFENADYFQGNWVRPVNIESVPNGALTDAEDYGKVGTYLRLEDLVNLYDWRKESNGTPRYFYNHLNYWGFYGVSDISVDLNDIKTDYTGTKQALRPNMAIAIYDQNGNLTAKAGADIPATIVPVDAGGGPVSSDYGFLGYRNSGQSLDSDYNLYLHATVTYKWGTVISDEITVPVKKTINLEP